MKEFQGLSEIKIKDIHEMFRSKNNDSKDYYKLNIDEYENLSYKPEKSILLPSLNKS